MYEEVYHPTFVPASPECLTERVTFISPTPDNLLTVLGSNVQLTDLL